MPAHLSIIIPTLNAESDLASTLLSLMEGVEENLLREVIVVDGGSEDATASVADAWGAEVVTCAPGRGGQLRAGAEASKGAWLLFLHADTRPDPGWAEAVKAAMQRGTPGYFWLRFRAQGLAPAWVARWANLRSRAFGLPYGDQGLLISRRHYDAAGGFPDQPLMEDVAIMRRLRGVAKPHPMGHIARTGADRYLRDGWVRRGARNLWLMTRYRLGAAPEALARAYTSSRN
ncbi:MAG: TIGR04283 family arsenosugar biosynthesis glycosyltransferase [Pseudomonadota bacterium]